MVAVIAFISCSGMSSPTDESEMDSEVASTKSHMLEQASSSSKPHAGVELNYKRPKNLQLGESIDLQLNFQVRAQAEQLSVKLSHDAGLQLNTQSQYEFDATTDKQHTVILQVIALQEGRKNIDISATILLDGRYQSRSFTIPLTIGEPASFKANPSIPGYTVDKAQGVVSMPAVESSK